MHGLLTTYDNVWMDLESLKVTIKATPSFLCITSIYKPRFYSETDPSPIQSMSVVVIICEC